MPTGIYDRSKNMKHGLRKHPLYVTWVSMRSRCYYKKNISYDNYGLRGIKVCDEWKSNFKSFYEWAIDNGWKPELSIDRIDNDGNYCPTNCRWATRKIQNNNTRQNRHIKFNGLTKTMSEWSEVTGIKVNTIFMRLTAYGWPIDKALSTIKN